MAKKQTAKQKGEQNLPLGYSDAELVGFCGINCKTCRAKGQQRQKLAGKLKESLQELPLDLFSQILPPFKNIKQVMEFLDFLPHMGGQTCCTAETSPCGDPSCGIRNCVKKKGFKTCAECTGYPTCAKLDFLKPFHASLITDLGLIKEKGLDQYVDDVISKSKLDPITIR
jgi:hypothetical protein